MRRSAALVALVAITLGLVAIAPALAARHADDWVLLGGRHVTDKVDHDTIVVTSARGTFRKIQLRVHERPVQFHKVVVHFGDGAKQELELREVIPAGGRSAGLDLKGGNRVISSIDLWYEAQSIGKGKGATVRVFARR
jgi:hypothetical protein